MNDFKLAAAVCVGACVGSFLGSFGGFLFMWLVTFMMR